MMQLFNSGWKFCKTTAGTTYEQMALIYKRADQEDYTGEKFVPVDLPHDFAIEEFETFYADATGWYVKECAINLRQNTRRIIYFDGVYMDSSVYVNGRKVYEWKYGYTPFEIDITPYITDGVNEIAVSVNYLNPNSRWYSGAGITRNVWMEEVDSEYIPRYGVYVNATKLENWILTVDTVIRRRDNNSPGKKDAGSKHVLEHVLKDELGQNIDFSLISENQINSVFDDFQSGFLTETIRRKYIVNSPRLWDIDDPYLYSLETSIENGSRRSTLVGFRTIQLNSDTGLWLNGRNIKINGVCEHHDFGMLGGAFYENAMERKLVILKNMGVNSIRLTHNPMDPKVMELCDRLGFLVVTEAFDMWEHSKTEYDYGRFFPEWHERDVRAWVLQDRNHPSLCMWSIGNEIYDIHLGQRGMEVCQELSKMVRALDPLHNGYITFGSNYMPWENAQKCAEYVEAVGYNYAEKYYMDHHSKHPDWIIYGSETSSIVYSRGVYHFPLEVSCMTDDDYQCSCMGNSTTSWGAKSIEDCVCNDRDMRFSLGQYIWTGFDYLGEPTPYHTKNSYFGAIDTAGFCKDAYYVWKSAWVEAEKDPFVYVSPYWDFNEGQMVDVRVMSNAARVKLSVNGKDYEVIELNREPGSGKRIIGDYKIPFEKGSITAVGLDETGKEIARMTRNSFSNSSQIVVRRQTYSLNGKEYELGKYDSYKKSLLFYEINAIDENGNTVENANDLVEVKVLGDGKLLALDNGDSTDYTKQSSKIKRLFNGKLLAVIQKTGEGIISVTAEKTGNELARKINLSCGNMKLTPDNDQEVVKVKVLPQNCPDSSVEIKVTDIFGNETGIAHISSDRLKSDGEVVIKAIGDGRFKLRALSKSGDAIDRVISELIFENEGFGQVFLNPYKLISGSVYSGSSGNITNGNERGAATARGEEAFVYYENVDFGVRGSREMTIPIFALDFERIDIDIYDGIYGQEGCQLICKGKYDHPRMWNVYQEETFIFTKKLTGIHTICFRTTEKIHIKGFVCKEYNPAYQILNVSEIEKVYGDSFRNLGDKIVDIGNNVTLDFGQMDFGENGPFSVTICGRAKDNQNTIHIRFSNDAGEVRNLMECDASEDVVEKTFMISGINKKGKLELIFLPGCNYDFKWIRFNGSDI